MPGGASGGGCETIGEEGIVTGGAGAVGAGDPLVQSQIELGDGIAQVKALDGSLKPSSYCACTINTYVPVGGQPIGAQ